MNKYKSARLPKKLIIKNEKTNFRSYQYNIRNCNICNRHLCLMRENNITQPCQYYSLSITVSLELYFKMREYLIQNNIKILQE